MSKERRGRSDRHRRGPARPEDVTRRRRIVDGIAKAIGVGIALLGAGLLAMATGDLVTGGDGTQTRAAYAGLMVVPGAMIWWGLQIGWPGLAPRALAHRLRAWNAARRAASQDRLADAAEAVDSAAAEREQLVLGLAQKEQGRVTVLEVASHCDLTADEAKALLDDLVLRKVAQLHVSEEGVLVYVFPRLLPGDGRTRRRRR
jgi:hypothetical protein